MRILDSESTRRLAVNLRNEETWALVEQQGSLQLDGATIENMRDAIWRLSSGDILAAPGSSGPNVFNNNWGTVEKTGPGNVNIGGSFNIFDRSLVDVQEGTLILSGDTTWDGGTIRGGSFDPAQPTSDPTGGTHNTSQNFVVTGTGGSKLLGSAVLRNTGKITQEPGSSLLLFSGSLILNEGVYVIGGDTDIRNAYWLPETHHFWNRGGHVEKTGAGSARIEVDYVQTHGTTSLTGNDPESVMSFAGPFQLSGGLVDVQTGTIQIAEGLMEGGTIQIAPGALLEIEPSATFEWTGGTIEGSGTGPGTLIIGGQMVITAPPINPTAPTVQFQENGPGNGKRFVNVKARVLDAGEVFFLDDTDFNRTRLINEGGTVVQTASITMSNNSGIYNQVGGKYILTDNVIDTTTPENTLFENTGGKFIKREPTEATVNVRFKSQGFASVEVRQGTLKLIWDDPNPTLWNSHENSFFRIFDNATLELAGDHEFRSQVRFEPPLGSTDAGSVVLPGATNLRAHEGSTVNFVLPGDHKLAIKGAQLLGPGEFIVNNTTEFSIGEINGGVVAGENVSGGLINTGASFTIVDGGAKTISGVLRNKAEISQYSSLVTTADGLIFNESGAVYNLYEGTISGEGRFRNEGIFRKRAGGAAETVIDILFDTKSQNDLSPADIRVDAGKLVFRKGGKHSGGRYIGPGEIEFRGSTTTVDGEMTAESNAKLLLTEGTYSVEQNGTLKLEQGAEFKQEGSTTIQLEDQAKIINRGTYEMNGGTIHDPRVTEPTTLTTTIENRGGTFVFNKPNSTLTIDAKFSNLGGKVVIRFRRKKHHRMDGRGME